MIRPDPVEPGQESVWDYPRPPIAEACTRLIRIEHRGVVVAESRRTVRTLETSHPPSYYIPPQDVDAALLRPSRRRSFCEWKGDAAYVDVVVGDQTLTDVGWLYHDPRPGFEILRDHVAFYAAAFDTCSVDGERAAPQPGEFYGGWITADLAGPFKGAPSSRFW